MGSKESRTRILVVEDETLIRRMAVSDLTGAGFEVYEAEDADKAVQLAESMGPFEVLFTDVRLPSEMNGLDLAAKLKREGRCHMVIYTSGYHYDPPRMVSPSLALRKPYMVESVIGAVRALEELLQAESAAGNELLENHPPTGRAPATADPRL